MQAWLSNDTYITTPTLDPSLRTWHNATQLTLWKMREGLGYMAYLPNLISGGFLNQPLPTEGDVDLTRCRPHRATCTQRGCLLVKPDGCACSPSKSQAPGR